MLIGKLALNFLSMCYVHEPGHFHSSTSLVDMLVRNQMFHPIEPFHFSVMFPSTTSATPQLPAVCDLHSSFIKLYIHVSSFQVIASHPLNPFSTPKELLHIDTTQPSPTVIDNSRKLLHHHNVPLQQNHVMMPWWEKKCRFHLKFLPVTCAI